MATLAFNYRFHLKGGTFFINPRGRYLADYYSEFDPTYRTSSSLAGQTGLENAGIRSYRPYNRLPVQRHGKFAGIQSAEIMFNLANVMNTVFISDAYDRTVPVKRASCILRQPKNRCFHFQILLLRKQLLTNHFKRGTGYRFPFFYFLRNKRNILFR